MDSLLVTESIYHLENDRLAVGAGRLRVMGVAWPWRLGVNLHRVDGTGTRLEETALRSASKDIASNADSWSLHWPMERLRTEFRLIIYIWERI